MVSQPTEPTDKETETRGGLGAFLARHEARLWWIHSVYALGLGVAVVVFAQRGFEHARWLILSVLGVWFLIVLLFRLYGSGAQRNESSLRGMGKVRYLVMTYVLKNLYQGMLFFLIPFYWRSSTMDAPNRWFIGFLALLALLSTLDIVFDRFLMRWKGLSSAFYAFTLFSVMNLATAALFTSWRPVTTQLVAAGVACVGFFTLHVPVRRLRRAKTLMALTVATVASVSGAWAARTAIPPVPMYLADGAVGPRLLEDGRLSLETTRLHISEVANLHAVTDISLAGGRGEKLKHTWRKDSAEIACHNVVVATAVGPNQTVRLRSSLESDALPSRLAGEWSVDTVTDDGQLVGRLRFTVTE